MRNNEIVINDLRVFAQSAYYENDELIGNIGLKIDGVMQYSHVAFSKDGMTLDESGNEQVKTFISNHVDSIKQLLNKLTKNFDINI